MAQTGEHISQVDKNIQFLRQLIKKPYISQFVRKDLTVQMDFIIKRRNDPKFYLAIIGEFSSGKSTFINALIRDDLLKTSALVATATTTRITYNESLSAEALFKTERPKQFIKQEIIKPVQPKVQIAWLYGYRLRCGCMQYLI